MWLANILSLNGLSFPSLSRILWGAVFNFNFKFKYIYRFTLLWIMLLVINLKIFACSRIIKVFFHLLYMVFPHNSVFKNYFLIFKSWRFYIRNLNFQFILQMEELGILACIPTGLCSIWSKWFCSLPRSHCGSLTHFHYIYAPVGAQIYHPMSRWPLWPFEVFGFYSSTNIPFVITCEPPSRG